MKKTLAPSIVNSRDPKGRKFMDIVAAAYDKARLSDGSGGEAQRVNDTGGLSDHITTFIEANRSSNKFKDEKVKSNYGYLSGYKPNGNLSIDLIVADFEAQSKKLDGWFNCGTRFNPDWIVCAHKVCPEWIEKFFAQFDWRQIASTYSEAVQKVLDTIKQTRNGFENYREGQIDEKRIRQLARTQKFFAYIAKAQGNPDIQIVPAQFGIRHRGRSVRCAREVCLNNELGLGAFAVGIMILTHPERLMNYDDLWIDCGGDEFDDPDSDVRFDRAPYFRFCGDGVEFGARWFGGARGHCGSASGLLPQQ